MTLERTIEWLEDTAIATAVREEGSLFPWIESVHVLALCVVIGSVATIELRLIGVALRGRPVSRVLANTLPWTWGAFALSVVSGSLLFVSNATTYAHNVYFLIKVGLLVALGLNALAFHKLIEPSLGSWDQKAVTPLKARLSGIFSLVGWVGLVACARWVGFTLTPVPPP